MMNCWRIRPTNVNTPRRRRGAAAGEGHLQAPPFLAAFVPWFDLFALETRVGIEEGQGEIGPQRLAGEIGDMELVPRVSKACPSKAFSASSRTSTVLPSNVSDEAVRHEDAPQVRPGTRSDH